MRREAFARLKILCEYLSSNYTCGVFLTLCLHHSQLKPKSGRGSCRDPPAGGTLTFDIHGKQVAVRPQVEGDARQHATGWRDEEASRHSRRLCVSTAAETLARLTSHSGRGPQHRIIQTLDIFLCYFPQFSGSSVRCKGAFKASS